MTEWTHLRYAEAAASEIDHMAGVVRGREGTVPVPSCPGWDLRALTEHTGSVHRWAAAIVRDAAPRRYDREAMDYGFPEDFAEAAGWLEAGGVLLTEALKSRDPDTGMWSWAGERNARFWSRRQLHETVVHRADAELALGVTPRIDEDVAADGVDEFFDVLPYARWQPRVAELRSDGEAIAWRTGTGLAWLVRLTRTGFAHERSEGPADVTVTVPTAGDLMLTLWNRREPDEVRGDDELLRFWRERAQIT